MNAVERVLHYTELPAEGDFTTPNDPSPTWPKKGKITFSNVEMAYRDGLPLVLKDVNFEINPGEKVRRTKVVSITYTHKRFYQVGIVGRTGAGKSSLLQAIFRCATFCSFTHLTFIMPSHSFFSSLAQSTLKKERLRSTVITFGRSAWMFCVESWLLYPKIAHCSMGPYVTICKGPGLSLSLSSYLIEYPQRSTRITHRCRTDISSSTLLAASERWVSRPSG
jgi:hypothetical protein